MKNLLLLLTFVMALFVACNPDEQTYPQVYKYEKTTFDPIRAYRKVTDDSFSEIAPEKLVVDWFEQRLKTGGRMLQAKFEKLHCLARQN